MIKIATLICACFAASFVNAEMEVTLTGVQYEHLYPFTGNTLLIAVQDANEITIKSTGKIVVTGNGIATDRSIEIHQQDDAGKNFLVKINKNPNAINSMLLNSSSNVKIMVHKLHSEVLDRSNETISLQSKIIEDEPIKNIDSSNSGIRDTPSNVSVARDLTSGVYTVTKDTVSGIVNHPYLATTAIIAGALYYYGYDNELYMIYEGIKWVYKNGKWVVTLPGSIVSAVSAATGFMSAVRGWWNKPNPASQGYWPGDRNPSPGHVQGANNPFINDDPNAEPRNYEPRDDGHQVAAFSWTDSPRNDNFTPNAYNPTYMTTLP